MSNLGGSYNSYEQLRATEFRLGKASRDAEVEDLRRQLVETEQDRQYQLATKANYMSDLNKVEEKLASRDAEILELKNNVTICVVRMGELRQQVTLLRDAMQGAWKDGYCFVGPEGQTDEQKAFEQALTTTEPKP